MDIDVIDNTAPVRSYVLCARKDGRPEVELERRGRFDEDRWAISNGNSCLNLDFDWEVERMPSNRPDEFLARTRFTRVAAMAHWRRYVAVGRQPGFFPNCWFWTGSQLGGQEAP
jgi:hypothetical protein